MTTTGYGCVTTAGLTVCSPHGNRFRAVRYCPVCKQRRRHLVTLFMWYGAEVVCCHCTTGWSDGYPRSRSRSQRVITRTRRDLNAKWQAETTTKDDAMAALMAEVESYA